MANDEPTYPLEMGVNWKFAHVHWDVAFPVMKFTDRGQGVLIVPRLKCRSYAVQQLKDLQGVLIESSPTRLK